jgi:hypothetical protein
MRPTDTGEEGDGKGDTRMVPHDWNTMMTMTRSIGHPDLIALETNCATQ